MADDINPGMTVPAPPFAAIDDLAKRWHELTDAERAKAETLLADASDKIITDCPPLGAGLGGHVAAYLLRDGQKGHAQRGRRRCHPIHADSERFHRGQQLLES